jgi:very-short-patch-repair endonuclease
MIKQEKISPILAWNKTKEIRRYLRVNKTKAEQILWNEFSNKQFHGLRMRRQHGVGPFIVDFYHRPTMLVIELDGEIHADQKVRMRDIERQKYLEENGYTVLRFTNDEIYKELPRVLEEIYEVIKLFQLEKRPPCRRPCVVKRSMGKGVGG